MKKVKRLAALLLAAVLLFTAAVQGSAAEGAADAGEAGCSVSLDVAEHGSLSFTGGEAAVREAAFGEGETVTVTAAPAEGYALTTVSLLDGDGMFIQTDDEIQSTYDDDTGETEFSFLMPACDVCIYATFTLYPEDYSDEYLEEMEKNLSELEAIEVEGTEEESGGPEAVGITLGSYSLATYSITLTASSTTYFTRGTQHEYLNYSTYEGRASWEGTSCMTYCVEPSKNTPAAGTYSVSEWSSDLARAACYYGYGGPGYADTTYGMFQLLFGSNSSDQNIGQAYTYSHLALSYIYDNMSDSTDAFKGVTSSGTVSAIKGLVGTWNTSACIASVPSSFKVYLFNTGSTKYQSECFFYMEKNGNAYVQKVSSDSTKVAGNSNYSLAGAVYGVYTSGPDAAADTNRVAALTTDSSGKTQAVSLAAGTYYVKEITASPGYSLDTATYTVEVTSGSTKSVTSTETYLTGDLKVIKYSDNTGVTLGNSNYDLYGAEFTVYSDASFQTSVGTVKIDTYDPEGGYYYGTLGGLLFGTYYIKESTAPNSGYAIDEKERSATVSVSGGLSAFWDRPVTITVNVVKSADTSGIELDTQSLSVESLMDSGSYSLEGATYGLYSAEACTADVLIATATTDADGNATFDVENLAMGTYYVREIEAPEGYDLDEEVHTVNATKDSEDLYTVSSTNKAIDISSEDPITGGKIILYKTSEEPSLLEEYPEYYSLDGAVYGVYPDKECTGSFLLTTITTDEAGYGITETTLPYGTYYVKEIPGYASPGHDVDENVYEATVSAETPEVSVTSVEPVLYRTLIVAKGPFSMLETGTAFDADIPASATSVVFTETKNIPGSYTVANGKLTDVSYSQDEGIVAWLDGTTWYVAAAEEGQPVYFNYDSSYMFAQSGAGTGTYNTNGHSVTKVDFGDGVIDTSFTTDISYMFANAFSVATIRGLDQFDTSGVTTMESVFHHAYRLYGDIDLSSWDTSSVTDMRNFMDNCWNVNSLTLGDGWDTSNVTDFFGFVAITSLTNANYQAIVDAVEIDSANDVGMMFAQTSSDDLDQYGASYTGGTTIRSYLTELDLSGWDLANNTSITDMEQMFRGAINLTNISGMYIPVNVESTYNMFNSCYRLGADTMWMMEVTVLSTADMFDCRQTFYNTSISDGADNTAAILRISYSSAAQSHAEEMYATAVTGPNSYGDGNDYTGYTSLIELASAATASIGATDSSTLLASAASFLSSAASMVRQTAAGITDGTLLASVREMFAPVEAVAADSDDETSLRNAVYSAYEDKSCEDEYWYGDFEYSYSLYDDDGNETAIYILENVPLGLALWVKEVKPSSGYGLDENVYEFEANDNESDSVESIEPPPPDDEPYTADITIHKTFTGTVNENYSLKGIIYRIYTDSSCKSGTELYVDGSIAALELTASGVSNTITITDLEEDQTYTYYIKEYYVPDDSGAYIDTETHPVTLTADDYKDIEVLALGDEPVYGELEVTKSSADTTITSGNENYSYVGAKFGIYTLNDDGEYILVDTMTTGDDYKATKEDVLLGTYYIWEIEAPPGFELDTTIYQAVVYLDDTGTKAVTDYSVLGSSDTTDELTVKDQPVTGTIEIYKYSADASVTDGNDDYSYEGAVFAVYESDGTTVYTTLTTDASGYASVSDVPLGTYYVVETEASRGYKVNSTTNQVDLTYAGCLSGKTYAVSVPETPTSVTITVVKSSADPDATDGNGNYTLEGAKFGIYTDAECSEESMVDTFTTDGDGNAGSKELAYGTYYIKELEAPEGYELNGAVYKAEATESGVAYTDMTTGETGSSLLAGNSLSVEDEPEYGRFRIYKNSSDRDLSDALETYTLAGATYGVYTDEDCTDLVDELVIGEDNYSNYTGDLTYGTYYVREISAPDGFLIDTGVYTVELTKDTVDADYALTLDSLTDEVSTGNGFALLKVPAQESMTASLAGAQFTIQYYDAVYTTEDEILSTVATKYWVIEVKEVDGVYMAELSDEYLVEGSDSLYYDEDGNVILPVGTYTIEETMPADLYSIEGDWYDEDGNLLKELTEGMVVFYVTQDGETGEALFQITTVDPETEEETVLALSFDDEDLFTFVKEDIALGSITVIKQDTDGTILEGVTYDLYKYNGLTEEYEYVMSATTGEEGSVLFDELEYGTYKVVESSTLDGLTLLAEPIVVTIPLSLSVEEAEEMGADVSNAAINAARDTYYFVDLTYTVTDHPEFQIPEAGVPAALPAMLGIGIAIVALGLFLILRRRRVTTR